MQRPATPTERNRGLIAWATCNCTRPPRARATWREPARCGTSDIASGSHTRCGKTPVPSSPQRAGRGTGWEDGDRRAWICIHGIPPRPGCHPCQEFMEWPRESSTQRTRAQHKELSREGFPEKLSQKVFPGCLRSSPGLHAAARGETRKVQICVETLRRLMRNTCKFTPSGGGPAKKLRESPPGGDPFGCHG